MLNSSDICREFPDFDKMKSINDILFSTLKETIKEAPNMILDLAPLGKFYYRKVKTKNYANSPDVYPETKEFADKVLKMYELFDEDKKQVRYAQHGKESHEAFLLAKKQGKVPKFQKAKPEEHLQLPGS